ncbi:MAG: sensor histidine kinase KdpD [Actinobacteria bacterium]|nr:sensor histidine kinase KdpD [Actinomycetota bacterium]
MKRGSLRIYLGAAPGVGKTYAMLNEGRRRRDRGTDVVVGFVETHDRRRTVEQVGDLEVIPRRTVEYRGSTFSEMDLDAILARRPAVALVDELAHTNVPGSRNDKRWQDVAELLDAGIDVISTVNIQHLESVNDVVHQITGVVQQETVPDDVVRAADQIELVDQTPEALRRRMAHGNIYAPDKIDAALTNYFRPGNLSALRELAMFWVADQVDLGLEQYREHHEISELWETRERAVVAVTGAPASEALIRRAARIAQRTHGELIGVHIRVQTGLIGDADANLAGHRHLLEELGGTWYEIASPDVARALTDFARAENATLIVLGSSRRGRWAELTRGSVINRVVRESGGVDVMVFSPDDDDVDDGAGGFPRRLRSTPVRLSRRRVWGAWAFAAVVLPVTTVILTHMRGDIELSSVLLLYLLVVVAVAATGGALPAIAAAVAGFLLANWYFAPPYHRFTIVEPDNVLALVVYLLVAAIVSILVFVATRRTAEAARAGAEAETLAGLAGSLGDADPRPVLLTQVRRAFGFDAVSLLRRDGEGWVVDATDGDPPGSPSEADDTVELADGLILALRGDVADGADRRVLETFGAHLAAALDRQRLREQAAEVAVLEDSNKLRAALLQAVSHDLRTPLANIKASIDSLRQQDIVLTDDEVDEFRATIEDETDRMTALVVNLLDMSRIHADSVAPELRSVAVDDVIVAALDSLGPRSLRVTVDVPDGLPTVRADAALLERAIANLVDNALVHTAPGTPVRVDAGAVADRVIIRVVDRGQGIPLAERARVFEPFQRSDDRHRRHGTGVGLGLAVASGFVHSCGGTLEVEDTPGGGTTMLVTLEEFR